MHSILVSLTSALRARPCRGAAQLRPRRSARARPPAQHRGRPRTTDAVGTSDACNANINAFMYSPCIAYNHILPPPSAVLRVRGARRAAPAPSKGKSTPFPATSRHPPPGAERQGPRGLHPRCDLPPLPSHLWPRGAARPAQRVPRPRRDAPGGDQAGEGRSESDGSWR